MSLDMIEVEPDEITLGDHCTIWAVNDEGTWLHGQGGTFAGVDNGHLLLDTTCFGRETYPVDGHVIVVERPFPAEECLEFSDECSGPVELRWPGSGHASWPRCAFHGERRLKRAEHSIEQWADSDVAPDWFDPSIAGERWNDDY